MAEVSSSTIGFPVSASRDVLSEVLRAGAQQMLATAIEAEVSAWIAEREHLQNEQGHRQVIRNGHLPKRQIITGVGPLEVQQPRVRDRRRLTEREPFHSQFCHLLAEDQEHRRVVALALSEGHRYGRLQEALQSLLGPECPGLSASTVTQLIQQWQAEYQLGRSVHWAARSTSTSGPTACTSTSAWKKIAPASWYSWRCRGGPEGTAGHRRRLSRERAVLDRALVGREVPRTHGRSEAGHGRRCLGLLEGLAQGLPQTGAQRCWFHKSGNVIDQLPKRLQAGAKKNSTRSGWPTPVSMLTRRSICSSRLSG